MSTTELAQALYLKSADSGWYPVADHRERTVVLPRPISADLAEIIATVLFLYDSGEDGIESLEAGMHSLTGCGTILTLSIEPTRQPHLQLIQSGVAEHEVR